MKIPSAALFTTLLLTACGGGGDGESTMPATDGTVRIAVKAPDGSPVADVSVELGGESISTDSEGIAEFTMHEDFTGTATLSKEGYMGQQIPVMAPVAENTSAFDATIKQHVLAGEDIDFSGAATVAVTVEGADGANVTISDNNAFVSSDGTPYVGLVDVFITPVDVTDEADRYAFPGEYTGIAAAGGDAAPIVSYGMADYTFSDQSGSELQLADGVTATIDIPIYDETAIGGLDALVDGAQVPMWYYDYEDEVWKENELGEGTVFTVNVGGSNVKVLRGPVNHFTPWNVDDFPRMGTLRTNVYCGVNEQHANRATAHITSGGRTGTYSFGSNGDSGLVSVGTNCVTITNVSCPSGIPITASSFSRQCTSVSNGGVTTLNFEPNN